MTTRCVHVTGGKADFTYIYGEELDLEGENQVDRKILDKLINISLDANYRVVVRDTRRHRSDGHQTLYHYTDISMAYKSFIRYLTWTTYDATTVTIAKYTDDTFTTLMDIPLGDPVVMMMSYWYSDAMRISRG